MSLPSTSHRAYELPPHMIKDIEDELAALSATSPDVIRVQELLRKIIRYGADCPGCKRNVQYNRKKTNVRHVRFAAAMLAEHGFSPFKVSTELTERYTGAVFTLSGVEMLRYVGLIEKGDDIFIDYLCDDWPCNGTETDPCKSAKKRGGFHRRFSGVWRCTPLLKEFLDGTAEVPAEVFFFGKKAFAVSTETVAFASMPAKASGYSADGDEDEETP